MAQIRGEWEFSECLGYSGDHTPSISVFYFLDLCLPHGLGASGIHEGMTPHCPEGHAQRQKGSVLLLGAFSS